MPSVPAQNLLPILVLMVVMVLIFWATVIRPQAKAAREHQELLKNLQVGDRILTAGGIHGKITALEEDTFTLEIASGVRVVFDRRAARKRLE